MLNYLLSHTPLLYFVQSFWRDEAFSVLAAKQSLGFIITKLGFEPPVYYTLLHVWMRIFGESELASRSLSIVGFVLATIVMIEWAYVLYKKHWLSWYLPLFFFINPMLLYYAFEVRTYAWYTFFATVMLYTYTRGKWRWFIASATLGFYTHAYLLPFIGALGLHRLWTKRKDLRDVGIKSFLVVGLLILPWLIKIGLEMGRMQSSWYYPVNWQLVKSALGNLFTGYEGTPWYGWTYTSYLSLLLVGCTLFAITNRKQRPQALLMMLFGGLPLAVIIGISFIKPLFVNRYLIPTAIAEVLIVTSAIAAIRNPWFQKIVAGVFLAGILWFNWWYPPEHPKPPVRTTFEQIQTLLKDGDIVVAADPIIYMETLYYTKDRARVYLYNPDGNPFPWYIGDALVTPERMLRDVPTYPARAFLVHADTSFEVTYRMPL